MTHSQKIADERHQILTILRPLRQGIRVNDGVMEYHLNTAGGKHDL